MYVLVMLDGTNQPFRAPEEFASEADAEELRRKLYPTFPFAIIDLAPEPKADQDEYWTLTQVAEYLGRTTGSASEWLSRNRLLSKRLYDAEAVRAARASEPGQGARTDLRR